MTPYYVDDSVQLFHGDCLDVLRELPDASVDAVCTDPPYALEFMGKTWDGWSTPAAFQEWCGLWAAECLRVLKPGGHMLAFGGSRTWHRLAAAVEDAGFEIRDSIAWLYGQGFPKSLDVSKAIDKAAGAQRNVVGHRSIAYADSDKWGTPNRSGKEASEANIYEARIGDVEVGGTRAITAPATPDAEQWQGWGTALKPAFEPIVVGRKPLDGTVVTNVLAHGTGALNIDATRVGDAAGRWPANVVLDDSQAGELDQQSGQLASHDTTPGGDRASTHAGAGYSGGWAYTKRPPGRGDSGGASRYFPTFRYEAKAPTAERPTYYTHSCTCEDSWPTPSRGRATSATTSPTDSSTSRSGSSTTGAPSPMATTSTTSTTTSRTTTPGTSSSSPGSSTSESTPDASSATESGGSPAASAASSSLSGRATGTSAAKAGRSTGAAGRATSHVWSATSVCGSCGAPARREAHATVKPLDLMRWLVRLVTPPGGVVLEPFAGSGTTAEACVLEGFRCIAIEREADYLPLIVSRLNKPLQLGLELGA